MVPSQLKTFTALGNAIIMVETMKVIPKTGFIPDAIVVGKVETGGVTIRPFTAKRDRVKKVSWHNICQTSI